MRSFKFFSMAIMASACILITPGCGGGGGDTGTSVVSRTKQLIGKVIAKLTGGAVGKIQAEVKQLSDQLSEISGSVLLDGTAFDFKTTVDADNNFYLVADNLLPATGGGGGGIVTSGLRLRGKLIAPTVDGGDIGIEGTFTADLPLANGNPGQTVAYSGSVAPDSTITTTTTPTTTVTLPNATGCEWSATAFYNEKQVVTYQGRTYTANQAVVPLGQVAAVLLNPAMGGSWTQTPGVACEPTPFVVVDSAVCTRGSTSDVIVMTGRAYGGGVGDTVVSYTNLTDFSYSVENNFGLPNSQYSITCEGGGFTGRFSSATSPAYSVCLKTATSPAEMRWTSSQTIARGHIDPFKLAYASKGSPIRSNMNVVGAVVLGFGSERSAGKAITGNCN